MAAVDELVPVLSEVADANADSAVSVSVCHVELMWMLRPYLAVALADSTTQHGVFLDVLGMGVLITGGVRGSKAS